MKRHLLVLLATCMLTACGNPLTGLGASAISTRGDGTDALEGLPDNEAAHASVETQAPTAFALTSASADFRNALETGVRPLRQNLAKALMADATVSKGLSSWETAATSARLNTLKQVAVVEGQVMSFNPPPVVDTATAPPVTGMMAFYQPGDNGDIGQVTIYSSAMSANNKYLALATLVHEMRHAAQYQLVLADESAALKDAGQHALAQGYADAWQAMDGLGGESALAYGDYVHLDVEFDAFETGNEVAALVGGSAFDPTGSGFVDVQYSATDAPKFDLLSFASQLADSALVAQVNQAEYTAEVAERGSRQTPIPQQRYGGVTRTPVLRSGSTSSTRPQRVAATPTPAPPIYVRPGSEFPQSGRGSGRGGF